MNFEIKGIHYEVSDKTREQIEKKINRLQVAEENVTDLVLSAEKANGIFNLKVNMTFRWGPACFIEVKDHDLYDGIDKMIEKIKTKIVREKEKIQQK